jgi:hypothetical protein
MVAFKSTIFCGGIPIADSMKDLWPIDISHWPTFIQNLFVDVAAQDVQ